MVAPDREMPGMMASPCTMPMVSASVIRIWRTGRPGSVFCRVNQSRAPVTIKAAPTIQMVPNRVSAILANPNPIIAVGTLPARIIRIRRISPF